MDVHQTENLFGQTALLMIATCIIVFPQGDLYIRGIIIASHGQRVGEGS